MNREIVGYPPKGTIIVIPGSRRPFASIYEVTGHKGETTMKIGKILSRPPETPEELSTPLV